MASHVIIADTHLGATSPERVNLLRAFLPRARALGTLVWNGDALDLLRFERAALDYGWMFREGDVYLSGNHDYLASRRRGLSLGDGAVFVTHGDQVDFGYAAARLQLSSWRRGPLGERVLGLLRRWSVRDTEALYEALFELGDDAVAAFEHPHPRFRPALIGQYARMLRAVLRAPPRARPVTLDLPPPGRGGFFGYATRDPGELLERLVALCPEAAGAHTVVLGHLHWPIDAVVPFRGRDVRVIVLGAWMPGVTPQYALWDGQALSVHDVEAAS